MKVLAMLRLAFVAGRAGLAFPARRWCRWHAARGGTRRRGLAVSQNPIFNVRAPEAENFVCDFQARQTFGSAERANGSRLHAKQGGDACFVEIVFGGWLAARRYLCFNFPVHVADTDATCRLTSKQPPLCFARWFCHGGIVRPRFQEISGHVWRGKKPQPLGTLLYGVCETFRTRLADTLADTFRD